MTALMTLLTLQGGREGVEEGRGKVKCVTEGRKEGVKRGERREKLCHMVGQGTERRKKKCLDEGRKGKS